MLTTLALLLAAASPSSPPCSPATAFTGTICAPQTPGKHAAIILLGGSEGGNSMAPVAAKFAQYGYVAVSVAYFNAPGLPKTLEDIPVETIGKAIDAIAKRDDVDADRIAVMGASKGGELALLVASTYPQIHAVVADVPSPFAWQGIAQGPGPDSSSWTVDGKPVPYVHYSSTMGAQFGAAFTTHAPLDLRKGYDAAMQQNKAEIPGAMFHLEDIHGPVLMLAGTDDQIWNSVAQCQTAMTYLHAHHHPYADACLQYAGAGHMFLFATPQHPLTQAAMGPFALLLGGTPQANLDAAKQAWPKVSAFLRVALQAGTNKPSK
ncbi:MAG TPA: acyl-CoA thioester hydrolase/BAAT C-terminal domain-containing protein [Candidatus Baltobacteraceae bacterium]|nr:acyl-CoA thioester hydrolase/BAAT C-terminal domain-containing protein [Candidatus Baltobacteraceae bacterium]